MVLDHKRLTLAQIRDLKTLAWLCWFDAKPALVRLLEIAKCTLYYTAWTMLVCCPFIAIPLKAYYIRKHNRDSLRKKIHVDMMFQQTQKRDTAE